MALKKNSCSGDSYRFLWISWKPEPREPAKDSLEVFSPTLAGTVILREASFSVIELMAAQTSDDKFVTIDGS
jgi:hypothetical protein